HAEAVALDQAGDAAQGADMFVTLEPCTPFPGKRTPSCAVRLVAAGVARVHVALADPDPNVSGRGIQHLRGAGIEVIVSDGAGHARTSLRPYLKHRETARPYVIARWASSLDGRTATATGESRWITGPAARDRSHQERARVDAILTGSGTVLADDPALTARPGGILSAHQPVRVIADARGRVSPTAALFSAPGHTIVATTDASDPAWRLAISSAGAQVILCESGHTGLNLDQLLGILAARGIMSIWAEAGATLLGALFDAALVDEVWAFLAPVVIGGTAARPSVAGNGAALLSDAWRLREATTELLGDDILVRGHCGPWEP
ncbi:MAG: bifunctional diaminohydroxyphosphoribosylaminopyrimidine deaminase/5-amino-6-(5-phosphoribosylamino)uracil reductase RibD, partial [Dehalococcoidia bacterium]